MAGGLSLASVGVNVLMKHWDELGDVLGMGHVRTAAEEMETLRKQTELTANEAERLARGLALPAKVKDLQGRKPEAIQRQEDEVSTAIGEAGIGNVARGIRTVEPGMVDSQGDAAVVIGKIDELKKDVVANKAIANNRGAGADAQAFARNQIEAIEKQIRQMMVGVDSELERARDKTAQQIAASGTLLQQFPGGLKRLLGAVRKDPKAFGDKGEQFATDLGNVNIDPRTRKQVDSADREAERTNAGLDQQQAADDAKRKAALPGNKQRFGNQVLADVALGRSTDKDALTKNIGDSMRKSVSSEDDISKYAKLFAQDVIMNVRGDARQTAQDKGVSVAEGAQQNLAKNSSEANQAAGIGIGSFTNDIASIFQRNQLAADKAKADPYAATMAESAKRSADLLAALLNAVQQSRGGGDKGGLKGPK